MKTLSAESAQLAGGGMTGFVATHPVGVGAWADRRGTARPWTPSTDRMIVVVPHPDDESLSVGGLIHQQRRAGVDVSVVAVTDGEAAYTPGGCARLGQLRTREQDEALTRLGVPPTSRRRLRLPDGGVDRHEDELVEVLVGLVDSDSAATIVAPSPLDVHPDHEAIGRAARIAAARRGTTLVSYYFWAWHLRRPEEISDELVSYELSLNTMARKQLAIANHQTQLRAWEGNQPVLDDERLVPATWGSEYFSVGRP